MRDSAGGRFAARAAEIPRVAEGSPPRTTPVPSAVRGRGDGRSLERAAILRAAESLKANAVVIDSIQTTFSEKLEMAPGSIGQVREVASQLLFWTKKNHVPVFLIGHITKDGSIAGPKALEHIVDTVLYFEGSR